MHHDDHDLLPLQVDAVWDTQALGVINPRDRKQYARTVKALLADTFKYLLVTIEYEPFSHLGRPHSISYNAVKELYGAFSNVKFIAQVPAAAPLKTEWKENVFWMSSGEEDRLDSKMIIITVTIMFYYRVQYWQARWATGQSQWNSEKPHQYLVKVRTSYLTL